eukprot:1195433-Prorocentrum_minimum.AAC.2
MGLPSKAAGTATGTVGKHVGPNPEQAKNANLRVLEQPPTLQNPQGVWGSGGLGVSPDGPSHPRHPRPTPCRGWFRVSYRTIRSCGSDSGRVHSQSNRSQPVIGRGAIRPLSPPATPTFKTILCALFTFCLTDPDYLGGWVYNVDGEAYTWRASQSHGWMGHIPGGRANRMSG